MKYEYQLLTNHKLDVFLKNIFQNFYLKDRNCKIILYENNSLFNPCVRSYNDIDFYEYNISYINNLIDEFLEFILCTSELVIILCDNFNSYIYMDSYNFKYNPSGFCHIMVLENITINVFEKIQLELIDQYNIFENIYSISCVTSIHDSARVDNSDLILDFIKR